MALFHHPPHTAGPHKTAAGAERTLILIKPEAIRRGLVGEIVRRFENRELWISAMQMVQPSRDVLEHHYHSHSNREFYDELIASMLSGPTIAIVIEGEHVIRLCRRIVGSTQPWDAEPGSIRGDYARTAINSLVHASDSPDAADTEIALWFPPQAAACP